MKWKILCVLVLLVVGSFASRARLEQLKKYPQKLLVPDVESGSEHSEEFSAFTARDGTLKIQQNILRFIYFSVVNESVVYGITSDRKVWKSSDAMFSFQQTTINPADSIGGIASSPVSDQVSYFISSSVPTGYITADGGSTFQTVELPTVFSAIAFHPTQRTWVLGWGNNKLYVSKEFGTSWVFVRDNVYQFSWCPTNLNVPDQRICMVTDVNTNEASGGGPHVLAATNTLGDDLYVLLPALRTLNLILHPVYLFVIAADTSGNVNLFVSKDSAQTFREALLPNNMNVPFLAPEQIIDDRNAVWFGVNHGGVVNGVQDGTIYISDTDGVKFTKALDHAVTLNNWWDVSPVQSLPGFYVANTLLNWDEFSTSGIDVELQTLLSVDNGHSWDPLIAPTVDSIGNPTNCSSTNGCYLNLFGLTTWLGIGGQGFYGDFYSSPSAIGLILATGNLGESLDFAAANVNTYMSRDGGESWSEINQHSSVYEYGDEGGILVIVQNQVYTTTAQYSLDEGFTWTSFTFSSTPMQVVNVFSVDPTGERVVIFGRLNTGKVAYIGLDFTQIFEKQCTAADYEEWSPKQAKSSCVLGRDIVYLRRKQGSACLNPPDVHHVVSVNNCNCTERDYECDYGFEPSALSNKCLKTDVYQPPTCSPGQNYLQTQGYRRIPGDLCINGLANYEPIPKTCPSPPVPPGSTGSNDNGGGQGSNGLPTGLVIAIIIGVLAAVILFVFIGIVIGSRFEGFRKKFPWAAKGPLKWEYDNLNNQIQMEDDDDTTNDQL